MGFPPPPMPHTLTDLTVQNLWGEESKRDAKGEESQRRTKGKESSSILLMDEIPNNHLGWCQNPVNDNNGINYRSLNWLAGLFPSTVCLVLDVSKLENSPTKSVLNLNEPRIVTYVYVLGQGQAGHTLMFGLVRIYCFPLSWEENGFIQQKGLQI